MVSIHNGALLFDSVDVRVGGLKAVTHREVRE